jgi:uracil phosphoribosyltransferase
MRQLSTYATANQHTPKVVLAAVASVSLFSASILYSTNNSHTQAATTTKLDDLLSKVKRLEEQLQDKEDDLSSQFNNVELIDTPAVRHLFTVIRNKDTLNPEYVRYADRLMTLLAEEGLARIGVKKCIIDTPCGKYKGLKGADPNTMCVVSIPRSGDILMEAVRRISIGISVGKILCQRDESDPEKRAKLFYSKLPANIRKMKVILVDPMLATGGSASLAINELIKAGCKPTNITFLNVVSCPEGLRKLNNSHPGVRVITAAIDPILNEDKFIVPGLGDFGDRYYRTE